MRFYKRIFILVTLISASLMPLLKTVRSQSLLDKCEVACNVRSIGEDVYVDWLSSTEIMLSHRNTSKKWDTIVHNIVTNIDISFDALSSDRVQLGAERTEFSREQYDLKMHIDDVYPKLAVVVNNTSVHLPPDVHIDGVARSFNGERLVWLLRRTCALPFSNVIGHYFPHYSTSVMNSVELWTSRPDGLLMHKEGCLCSEYTNINQAEDAPDYQLSWLPNNKKVSFVYHGVVYTFHID